MTCQGRGLGLFARCKTTEEVIDSEDVIAKSAYDLMKKVELDKKGIRLLGLGISNLKSKKKI